MKSGIGVFKGTRMVQKRAALQGTCCCGIILPLYTLSKLTSRARVSSPKRREATSPPLFYGCQEGEMRTTRGSAHC